MLYGFIRKARKASCIIVSDASSHIYKRVCPSVRPSVRPSVDWSFGNAFFFSNSQNEELSWKMFEGTHLIVDHKGFAKKALCAKKASSMSSCAKKGCAQKSFLNVIMRIILCRRDLRWVNRAELLRKRRRKTIQNPQFPRCNVLS